MKILHIHIGTPKTGTTAIQNFCVENEKILESKGYCYPLFPASYEKAPKVRAHFLVAAIYDENGERDLTEEQRIFDEGMEIVHETFQKFDNVILSDENIWRSMDVERPGLWELLMQEAKKGGFLIHVVVYLRRQDQYLISLWNQQLKMNKGKLTESTIEEYMDAIVLGNRMDYEAKLNRMAEVVGAENITVRRFERGRFKGGSIYSDFLDSVGLSLTEEYDISMEVRNIGLYGNMHELKRVLNGIPQMQDKPMQDFIMARLRDCSEISAKNYPCEMLSKEEIADFLGIFEEGNRNVAEKYLHEPGEELFDNTIEDLPKWEKENPYMFDDLVRFLGVTSIFLHKENQKLREDIKGIKKIKNINKKDSGMKKLTRRVKHIWWRVIGFFKHLFLCIYSLIMA